MLCVGDKDLKRVINFSKMKDCSIDSINLIYRWPFASVLFYRKQTIQSMLFYALS